MDQPTPAAARTTPRWSTLAGAAPALLISLLPKCPMCLAAYLTLITGVGVDQLPLAQVWPVALAVLAASLGFAFWRAWARKRLGIFALAFAGALTVVLARWLDGPRPVVIAGFAALVIGLFWLSVSARGKGGHGAHRARCH